MGMSVCSDSFDVSVASVSASASISGVSCGNGGVEDILVGRCGFATYFASLEMAML